MELVLASASPRRKELLNQIGVQFSVKAADICEAVRPGETSKAYVKRLAIEKAQAAFSDCSLDTAVLGADTTVVLDGNIIGKPQNKADAIDILMGLSGKTHQVITSVAIVSDEQTLSVVVETNVTFRTLSMEECDTYWNTGEPLDKAGSYGIQGFGAVFVDRIEGSYSAVVGLPLAETAELLQVIGVSIWQQEEIQG